MRIRRVPASTLLEVLPEPIHFDQQLNSCATDARICDLFIAALGFEQRTSGILCELSKRKDVNVKHIAILRYRKNVEDNKLYENEFMKYVKALGCPSQDITLDDERAYLSQLLAILKHSNRPINVWMDISTMSSFLILSLMGNILRMDVNLTIFYTEAQEYYPTSSDYKIILDQMRDQGSSFTGTQVKGIAQVRVCPDFEGGVKERSDMIICFPSFNAQRTLAIISAIDDMLIKGARKHRVHWMLGNPKMSERERSERIAFQKSIHGLTNEDRITLVSTFHYRETVRLVSEIITKHERDFHISISDVGAKLQSLGLAFIGLVYPRVTICYSEPTAYNAKEYSKGMSAFWSIPLGSTKSMTDAIARIGQFELIE